MSALYIMRFLGGAGMGVGAIYIGRGTVVGVDMGDARYQGTYTEANGRLRGTIQMTLPSGGMLVIGQQVPPGFSTTLNIDWPINFTAGQQMVSVQGRQVNVTLEKVGDIP